MKTSVLIAVLNFILAVWNFYAGNMSLFALNLFALNLFALVLMALPVDNSGGGKEEPPTAPEIS